MATRPLQVIVRFFAKLHYNAHVFGVETGTLCRLLSSTAARPINQKWRQERGLRMNPNACGALTDGADYAFLDGRPTPYGANQKRRILRQREIAERIIALTAEVDFAVARRGRIEADERRARQQVLEGKLRPKGKSLLKR